MPEHEVHWREIGVRSRADEIWRTGVIDVRFLLLYVDTPEFQMISPELYIVAWHGVYGKHIQFAIIRLVGCVPYTDLKGAEGKVLVRLGEMTRQAPLWLELERVAYCHVSVIKISHS